MADIQEIYDLLLAEGYQDTLFQDLRLSSKKVKTEGNISRGGRETVVDCPFCHSEGHFYYSSQKPLYQCFKCGKKGDWLRYLQERNRMDFREALGFLAEAAGVQISQEQSQKAKERAQRAGIYEIAQELFVHTVHGFPGKPVADYLRERGYSGEEVEKMELGAYLDRDELRTRLEKAGFSEQDVWDSGLFSSGFGEDYTLSILWRDRAGNALGYSFRTLLPDKEQKAKGLPKYKNTPGLDKAQGLPGYHLARGARSILLVEGLLDQAILNLKGIDTIALAGTSLSEDVVKSLERTGTEELILALDTDEAGLKATERTLAQIQGSSLRGYVVQGFQGYKDPDELIRAKGVKALREELQKAERGAKWRAWYLVGQYELSQDRGVDEALEKAMEVSIDIQDKLDRDSFLDEVRKATGLTEEQLASRAKDLERKAQEKRIQKLLEGLHTELGRDIARRDTKGASQRLSQVASVLQSKVDKVALPEPYSFSQVSADLLATPPGLKTGWAKLDEVCLIPPGAITIVAGRPGHGKTTTLLNLLVNFLEASPDKSFHFFSYEEAKKFLALKLVMIMAGVLADEKAPGQSQRAYLHYLRERRGTIPEIEKAIAKYDEYVSSGRLVLSDEMLPGEDLATTIGYLAQGGKVGAILVDYIQRIPLRESKAQRYLDIKEVSSLLLAQAVSTDVPIILGAQLGRGKNTGKADISLDNLRESGDIENDANVVLGVHNKSVEEQEEEGKEEKGREVDLDLRILKNRGALAGRKVSLIFDRPILKMKDLETGKVSGWA